MTRPDIGVISGFSNLGVFKRHSMSKLILHKNHEDMPVWE